MFFLGLLKPFFCHQLHSYCNSVSTNPVRCHETVVLWQGSLCYSLLPGPHKPSFSFRASRKDKCSWISSHWGVLNLARNAQSHGACVGSQPGAPDRHPPSPELRASDASIAMAHTASATSPDAGETGLGQRPLSYWSPTPKLAFHDK